jgi:endo-1,4-beta-xylanase
MIPVSIPVSRRRLLQMAAAGVVAATGRMAVGASSPSLGEIAARNGYLFGAAAAEVIDKDAAYRDLYITQTKIITTDVALKIGRIAPQPGPKHFETADRLLAFCNQHKIAMRGHCLVWNEWNPDWVKNMSASERRMFFDSYIEEVVSRYAGKLQSWDIVNEPFWPGHRAPGGFRLGPWYDAFGPDYVRRAFERAALVDRTTKFVLNEAQTERDDELGLAVRRGLLKLVADLKNAGVKLDVVGLQGHLQPQYPHDRDDSTNSCTRWPVLASISTSPNSTSATTFSPMTSKPAMRPSSGRPGSSWRRHCGIPPSRR